MKGLTSRAFVQEVWLDGVPVGEMWYEGVKIYPDERTSVRDLVLSVPEGDTRYWKHAVYAAAHGEALMEMTLGDRKFHLGTGDGSLPVLTEVGGAWRVEDGELLLADTLRKPVTVRAEVPERTGAKKIICAYESQYEITWEDDLPLLEGSRFGMELRNYSRKRSAYSLFHDITSLPSGRTWNAYQGNQKNWYRPFTNSGLIKDADVPEDDNAFSCVFATSGGCYYDPGQREYQYAFPWWPAFERTWDLKILGVTLQHKVN